MKIAIPSEIPGGLDSRMHEHFGICPLFTVITLTNGEVSFVEVVENPHHGCGNCIQLIDMLSLKDISCVITNKVGLFPLNMLKNFSISALLMEKDCTVGKAVDLYMKNKLYPYASDKTCGGECGC